MESPLKAWIRALERTASIEREPLRTFPVVIESLAGLRGGAVALSSAGGALTYAELSASADRFARWGISCGLARGDVVCLLMPNRPEYLAIWIGLTRIGVTVALLVLEETSFVEEGSSCGRIELAMVKIETIKVKVKVNQ